MDMKEVVEYFPIGQSFTKEQFCNQVREVKPDYAGSSISWLLSELKREEKIISVGRGKYIRTTKSGEKSEYTYSPLEIYQEVEKLIAKEFPLVEFQMWEMYQMNEFVNHLFGKNTIFVDVENMCEDVVFEMLHEKFPYALFCPSEEMYHKQKGNDNTIVVQRLISETPKPAVGHSAPLEKILVDLFSKKLTGKLIVKSEYPAIYEQAFERYYIDEAKMFRYARRRSLDEELITFLKERTSVNLKYN